MRRPVPVSPWSRRYAGVTTGILALTVIWSFESLAVASIMPEVATALHGLSWYAISFAATSAASAVAFTVAGPWIDRRGSDRAMTSGCLGFAAGLVICGLAPSMPVFLLGRAVQGLGGGTMIVALYVVIAESYPMAIRSAAFNILTVGWILPALIGPALAATVAQTTGWRVVFLTMPLLTLGAWALVRRGRPALLPAVVHRQMRDGERLRLAPAGLVALGIVLISWSGQRSLAIWPVGLAAGMVTVAVAARQLLPPGTWTARPGVPSIIATRGLLAAAFFGAETYVPLLLTLDRGLSLRQAGWFLAGGSVTWCVASWAGDRIPALSDPVRRLRLGAVVMATGVVVFVLTVVAGAAPVWAWAAWCLCGGGVGLAYVTATVLALDSSPPEQAGRVSASLQLGDALPQALVLSFGSVVFNLWAPHDPIVGAAVAASLTAVVAAAAYLASGRTRPPVGPRRP